MDIENLQPRRSRCLAGEENVDLDPVEKSKVMVFPNPAAGDSTTFPNEGNNGEIQPQKHSRVSQWGLKPEGLNGSPS